MIAYILNSTLCLLALFLIYRVLLANEKCYRFNRFYLLGALVLGLSLPALDFFPGTSQFIVAPNDDIAGMEAQQITAIKQAPTIFITGNIFSDGAEPQAYTVTETDTSRFPIAPVLFYTYVFIALILFSRYIYGIYSIYSRSKKMDHVDLGTTKLKLSDRSVVPHSFMDAIFVNKQDYEKGMISDQILDHEVAHIKGYHTLDVLFVELLKVIFWFNPGLYLIRRAILINHEFLADEQVLSSYDDIKEYQNQLLEVTENHTRVTFASNLNFYLTKKRLFMMAKKNSSVRNSIKTGLLIPLVPILILLFNTQVVDKGNLSGDYQIDLVADTVQVDENFSYLKWRTDEGALFSGSNKLFDPSTGILRKESIYDEGNLIFQKSYTGLGQVWSHAIYKYDNNLPASNRYYFSDNLFSEFIYPTPENEYKGVQRYWDDGVKYEAHFLSNPQNLHGLVTTFDEEGAIIEQERYENGQLIEKIK